MVRQGSLFQRNEDYNSNQLFNLGKINYSGSFGRSLSIGNNQDAVFNSQLNLQMNGYIGDSIEIAAAITDNNIPIQPDGTTQQLNEFDRILLQFKKKQWSLNLGDIDIRQQNNYFLRFYKRLQGVSYQHEGLLSKNVKHSMLVSGAIAKGKFTRNIFQGAEGNQGPYRLIGANNELYFVVLANTERVFIDGELMQRGSDQDYVINYNTSEITFMPKRMINRDRRIQIEFEYADRNYLNSLLYASEALQIGKRWNVSFGFYQNSDAKNSPINQTLDTKEKQFLKDIGDSIQEAFFESATIDSFSTEKIMYAKTANGGDSFYVYSTNKDEAKYSLNFINVGEGKGNYIPYLNGANGKVYSYVPPIGGVKQGSYEPATFLITPKKQQLLSVSSLYQLNKQTSLQTDVAISNYDVNTFSDKDKQDNKGMATRLFLENKAKKHLGITPLLVTTTAGYEYADRQFKPIERLRSVEFTRDWGLTVNATPSKEHIGQASIELKDSLNNLFKYSIGGYQRTGIDYSGVKQMIAHQQVYKFWRMQSDVSLTNNKTNDAKGYFLRPTVELNRTFPKLFNLQFGGIYTLEHNEQRFVSSDSLQANSYHFDVKTLYLKSNPSNINQWGLTYFTRADEQAIGKKFWLTSRSDNYQLQFALLANRQQQLRLGVTYRELHVYNTDKTNQTPENSLLGRAEYQFNAFKGLIVGNSLYEIGSGQEQKRDINYILVATGKGTYAWIDYNNDGFQQLNEFEIAQFSDQAKYIRLFTPTNVYVKSGYSQFNYSLTIQPRVLLTAKRSSIYKKFISKFIFQSALQTSKKALADGNPEFNPFKSGNIGDTTLISISNLLSNTLSFNRLGSVWGIDVNRLSNYSKNLLTYGYESREQQEWGVKGRLNFSRKMSLELHQKWGTTSAASPSFANKNYRINSLSFEPRISVNTGTQFRLQTSYLLSLKENEESFGGETARSDALSVETKYNAVQNSSLMAKFSYNQIDYSGLGNTTVSYIMLDGLVKGSNYLWSFELTKRLMNNLELSFQYEGRKPGETKVINTGRASLRALF